VRALIVTNMYPTPARPARGRYVRDQIDALRRLDGIELEVFEFEPGSAGAYLAARRALRRRFRGTRFDVVHSHFGLTAWPAMAVPAGARAVTLHGTDLAHPRSRVITAAALPRLNLVATASPELAASVPRWALRGREVAVLPCGVDMARFGRIERAAARRQLGIDPEQPALLFPADPLRPEKRYDRAVSVAGDTRLLTLGAVDPAEVSLWINAANAVLVTSEREGFGLAALEALACDVPVLATPCGVAPQALAGLDGALCAPFDADVWREALAPHLAAADPRVEGRNRAEAFSADRMAAQVLAAWRRLTGDGA
jgi:glycosyltransferase involved in cell wall biosynthesis